MFLLTSFFYRFPCGLGPLYHFIRPFWKTLVIFWCNEIVRTFTDQMYCWWFFQWASFFNWWTKYLCIEVFCGKYFLSFLVHLVILQKAYLPQEILLQSTVCEKWISCKVLLCKTSLSPRLIPLKCCQFKCILSVLMHLFRFNKSFMISFFWNHFEAIIGLCKFLNVKPNWIKLDIF